MDGGVLDILEESPVVEEVEGMEKTEFEGIKVEDVGFAYEDEQILDNYSVEIPKNKIVAIVGKSGSGKSTLLKLLMRFWDADEGKIEISGKDIKDINTSDLRKMEGYVTQEAYNLLKENKNINFIGNIESRDMMNGKVDVIVTDGFTGNMVLKTAEEYRNLFLMF